MPRGPAARTLPVPFIRWPGSKRRILPELLSRLPARIDRYFEPFLGGGTLYFALVREGRITPTQAWLADANPWLLNAWRAIRDDVNGVCVELEAFCRRHALDPEVTYARARERIGWRSATNSALIDPILGPPTDQIGAAYRAALFLYLNQTSYNGLWRVNRDGGFNVPRDPARAPRVDEGLLRGASAALQGARLTGGEAQSPAVWASLFEGAAQGDFYYIDPPYDGGFTAYTPEGFGPVAQAELFERASAAARRGAHVLISNADTPAMRDLYGSAMRIETVSARRSIAPTGEHRGDAPELLVTLTPYPELLARVHESPEEAEARWFNERTVRNVSGAAIPAGTLVALVPGAPDGFASATLDGSFRPSLEIAVARSVAPGAGARPTSALRSRSEPPSPPEPAMPPRPPPLAPLTVRRIEANLGPGIAFDLAPRTLIIAPNGSIKSMILNAVRLALTGRATDVNGRDSAATSAELIALAPGRTGTLRSVATLSDDSRAEWSIASTAAGRGTRPIVSRPTSLLGPDGDPAVTLLPLDLVRDAIRGNADTARRTLLPYIVGVVTVADIEARIAEPVRGRFRSVFPANLAPIDALPAAREAASTRVTAERGRIAAAQAILDGAGGGAGRSSPTMAQRGDAVNALASARRADAECIAAVARLRAQAEAAQRDQTREAETSARRTACEAEANSARGSIQAWDAEIARQEAALAAMPAADPRAAERIALGEALRIVLRRQIERPENGCVICGTACDAHALTARAAAVDQMVRDTVAQVMGPNPRERAAAALTAAQTTRAEWARYLSERESGLRLLLGAGAPFSAAPSPEDLAFALAAETQARATLQAVQSRRDTIESDAQFWAALMGARNTLAEATQERDAWTAVRDECDAAIGLLVEGALGAFVARVQRFLPASDTFDLRIREGTRDVFQFGLLRRAVPSAHPAAASMWIQAQRGDAGGVLHTALSGAEEVRIQVAMACAIVPDTARCAVIIPPDRAFDAETLRLTLVALANAPWQILWGSPIRPSGRPVRGWTYLEPPAAVTVAVAPLPGPAEALPSPAVGVEELFGAAAAYAAADTEATAAVGLNLGGAVSLGPPLAEEADVDSDGLPIPVDLTFADGSPVF